jgi:hypothetical protein
MKKLILVLYAFTSLINLYAQDKLYENTFPLSNVKLLDSPFKHACDLNTKVLQTSNAEHNTHGSIEQINGQWYVFYHRPPRGFGYARQAMVAPVKVEWDEKPVADGGKVS